MKTQTRTALFIMLTLAVMLAATPAAWALPRIKVLATGGTIAGAQATQADAGYKAGTFSVDDLIAAVPQLTNVAVLSGEQTANIGSQTMNHEVWLKLANGSTKCSRSPTWMAWSSRMGRTRWRRPLISSASS